MTAYVSGDLSRKRSSVAILLASVPSVLLLSVRDGVTGELGGGDCERDEVGLRILESDSADRRDATTEHGLHSASGDGVISGFHVCDIFRLSEEKTGLPSMGDSGVSPSTSYE